jgi:hypothetical protein
LILEWLGKSADHERRAGLVHSEAPWQMKRSTKIRTATEGLRMLFYPAALPLSSRTLTYLARVIRRHRKKIRSCWRKLNPGRQALLVLAYLRKGETFAVVLAVYGSLTNGEVALLFRVVRGARRSGCPLPLLPPDPAGDLNPVQAACRWRAGLAGSRRRCLARMR